MHLKNLMSCAEVLEHNQPLEAFSAGLLNFYHHVQGRCAACCACVCVCVCVLYEIFTSIFLNLLCNFNVNNCILFQVAKKPVMT